jgi:hypothetical protein
MTSLDIEQAVIKQGGAAADARQRAIDRLEQAHGAQHGGRIRTGVTQVADRWWPEDGDDQQFVEFCAGAFQADPQALDAAFDRLQQVMEQVDGHLHEVRREVLLPLDVERAPHAPPSPVDRLLVDLDLAPHVDEDLFRGKVAFFALLNFPVHTLRERLALSGQAGGWDRATWARSRMMDRFAWRVPAAVWQTVTRALTAAEEYINSYYIRMDRLVDAQGELPFPEGLRLISHWGLRDELRGHYADPDRDAALSAQRLIVRVMERIIRQEIPAAVIDNPDLLWEPDSNLVTPWPGDDAAGTPGAPAPAEREEDRRYAHLLSQFAANRELDPYTPTAPSLRARRFESERQIPEEEVEALLVSVLEAPEIDGLAGRIAARLGRPLEPFDIWYSGFKARRGHSQGDLDARVRQIYPTVAAFKSGLPDLLTRLGFAADRAAWLAERIEVDPARGAGHAMPAIRRQDHAHLRTRVGQGGMDYQGYNVAMHELGHNVEQVFSLNGIDHWWLAGVPNNAFTEAFAFTFQERDLELLGLAEPRASAGATSNAAAFHAHAQAMLWNTYEIAGVSLVDMQVWRWLYANPDATPAAAREAVRRIAREVWNRWFAPRLGSPDCEILAIYSHMIAYALYLPDYALGHIVAFQLAARLQRLQSTEWGAEIERTTRQGRLTPDAWIRGAVGGPLSADALLGAARAALAAPDDAG